MGRGSDSYVPIATLMFCSHFRFVCCTPATNIERRRRGPCSVFYAPGSPSVDVCSCEGLAGLVAANRCLWGGVSRCSAFLAHGDSAGYATGTVQKGGLGRKSPGSSSRSPREMAGLRADQKWYGFLCNSTANLDSFLSASGLQIRRNQLQNMHFLLRKTLSMFVGKLLLYH